MDLKPGKYIANPIGGGMGQNKSGSFAIGIKFKFKEDPNKIIWWKGTMKGGGIEICTKTLAIVGFRDDLPEVQEFGPEYVNALKDVELDIQEDEYEKKNEETGETKTIKFMKVAWVNEPGGGMKFGSIEPGELKAATRSVNLRAEIAKARTTLGIKSPKPVNSAPQSSTMPPPPSSEPSFSPNDDAPF